MTNSRREFIKLANLAGAAVALPGFVQAYDKNPVTASGALLQQADEKQLPALNRFPRMVQEYYTRRLREIGEEAAKRYEKLRTKADAEEYVREVQQKIRTCFGVMPVKTPLNSRVTGIVKRDAYTIEKVIFDSRPDFPVTANLYIPRIKRKPMPAVLGTCGHSFNGKAEIAYQSFAQGLARQGYVVLLYDPPGQGERFQYPGSDNKSRIGAGVLEHLYAGNQMILTGDSLFSWFVWDGIRAMDYLLTRPEADPRHIGITGNSGGGTQTTWICGMEPRITMAAPSCFVTTFLRNMENELPADTEQYPPKALKLGLDHADFIAAMAPKPVILLGQEKDFFDVRGLQEAYDRLKRLYELLGAGDQINLFFGPDFHGYSRLNREAMYGWFNKATGISDQSTEPTIEPEKDETLRCTKTGQVAEFKPRSIFSYTSLQAASLKGERKPLSAEELKKNIVEVLRLPAYDEVPYSRVLRPLSRRLYPRKNAAVYVVETEPGITIPVYRLQEESIVSRPPAGFKRALLYVSHHSADQELRTETFLRELIDSETESALFACDVRGTGESQPNTCANDFLAPYGNDYFYAGHGLMLDYPYPGQKTFDLLRILNWLKSFGHQEVHIVAKGWGTLPAVFAALLSDQVVRITLKDALTSFNDVAGNEEYKWPLSYMVPGILKKFDLPDCYMALSGKNLRRI